MDREQAVQEANKALHKSRESKFVNFLSIPLHLARALRDLADEWIKGSK